MTVVTVAAIRRSCRVCLQNRIRYRGKRTCCRVVWSVLLLVSVKSLLLNIGEGESGSGSELALYGEDHVDGVKTILLWNDLERPETAIFGTGRQTFVDHGCDVTECEIFTRDSQKKRAFELFDAIVFNFNDQFEEIQLPTFKRRPHQRFVLLTQEPPTSLHGYYNFSSYDNVFNWTMTYRLDSDVQFRYGHFKLKTSESSRIRRRLMTNAQRKIAVAMISNCETPGERETYIAELKRHVKVDVLGSCGRHLIDVETQPCVITNLLLRSTGDCFDSLASRYKFYLAFENSICEDYATEKFFNILPADMVPVVYGGANYSAIAPPNSFIDARTFSPKELAEHLLNLDQNDKQYLKYFDWKLKYEAEAGQKQMTRHGFCSLCAKLHQDRSTKSYAAADLTRLWDYRYACQQPSFSRR